MANIKSIAHKSITSSFEYIVVIEKNGSSLETNLVVLKARKMMKKVHIKHDIEAPIHVLNRVSPLNVNSIYSPKMSTDFRLLQKKEDVRKLRFIILTFSILIVN